MRKRAGQFLKLEIQIRRTAQDLIFTAKSSAMAQFHCRFVSFFGDKIERSKRIVKLFVLILNVYL